MSKQERTSHYRANVAALCEAKAPTGRDVIVRPSLLLMVALVFTMETGALGGFVINEVKVNTSANDGTSPGSGEWVEAVHHIRW